MPSTKMSDKKFVKQMHSYLLLIFIARSSVFNILRNIYGVAEFFKYHLDVEGFLLSFKYLS